MGPFQIRSNQRIIDSRGRIIMGEGRLQILEAVETHGSINRAAKVLNMSYKTMWCKIRSTETHSGLKIVSTHRRHGTRLTDEGRELMEKYRRLKQQCRRADDRIFKEVFGSRSP